MLQILLSGIYPFERATRVIAAFESDVVRL